MCDLLDLKQGAFRGYSSMIVIFAGKYANLIIISFCFLAFVNRSVFFLRNGHKYCNTKFRICFPIWICIGLNTNMHIFYAQVPVLLLGCVRLNHVTFYTTFNTWIFSLISSPSSFRWIILVYLVLIYCVTDRSINI